MLERMYNWQQLYMHADLLSRHFPENMIIL